MNSVNLTTKEWDLILEVVFNNGHVIAIITFSIIMFVSVIGNLFVLSRMIRIRCGGMKLSRMNILLLHLSIADLFVTLFMMPVEFGWSIPVTFRVGDILCRLISFLRYFGLYLSCFVVMCISIDRYFAVLKPIEMRNAYKRSRLMLCGAWSASIVFSLPQIWTSPLERHPVLRWYEQCISFQTFTIKSLYLPYTLVCLTFMYILPSTTTVFCYTAIIRELSRTKVINCLKCVSMSTISPGIGFRCSSTNNITRSVVKTVKTTVLIVSSFSFFWTPYNIMLLWNCIHQDSAQEVDPLIVKGLLLFASVNSCINPIVYSLIHSRHYNDSSRHCSNRSMPVVNVGVVGVV